MKKIVFGITSLRPGGAERVLIDIVNQFQNDYEITVFALYGDGEFERQLSDKIHFQSLYPHTYDSYSKWKKIWISFQLVVPVFRNRIYKKHIKNQYDIEIAFLEGPITWLMSGKSCAKKYAWIHNDLVCVYEKESMKKKLSETAYQQYQKLIFVSQDNLEKFQQLFPENHVSKQVIYNYIDEKQVKEKAEAFSVTEIQNDLPNFLQVSRFTEQKAILRLVDVHHQLIQKNIMHRIYLIGDGPLQEQVREKIKQYGVEDTFVLLGQKENPYPYMKKADTFLLASYYEGYPMVLLEAKVLGKDILITESAAKEVLIGYDKGMIVENTEEGISYGIETMIHREKNLKEQSSFSNESILEELKELLGE